MNCSDVSVTECAFSKLGGSGVTFNGVALDQHGWPEPARSRCERQRH